MSELNLRYYLRSKVASTGQRPIYLPVGVGAARSVRVVMRCAPIARVRTLLQGLVGPGNVR